SSNVDKAPAGTGAGALIAGLTNGVKRALSSLGPNRAAAGAPRVVAAKFTTQSSDGVAAPAQPAGAAPAASDQPDLKAVNIDFIPGEKTIFYDDFSDMAQDEPPPHWKLRDGSVELRTGGGIRQLTTVCPGKPSLHSASFAFPKNFTMEVEVAFATDAPSIEFLAWPKDVDGGQAPTWRINMSAGEIALKGPKDEQIG